MRSAKPTKENGKSIKSDIGLACGIKKNLPKEDIEQLIELAIKIEELR